MLVSCEWIVPRDVRVYGAYKHFFCTLHPYANAYLQNWTAIKRVEMSTTDAESFEAGLVPVDTRKMLVGEMSSERKSLKSIGQEWQQVHTWKCRRVNVLIYPSICLFWSVCISGISRPVGLHCVTSLGGGRSEVSKYLLTLSILLIICSPSKPISRQICPITHALTLSVWTQVVASKRQRTATTIQVNGFTVLRCNNYSMADGISTLSGTGAAPRESTRRKRQVINGNETEQN